MLDPTVSKWRLLFLTSILAIPVAPAQTFLPGTTALKSHDDVAAEMVDRINRFLEQAIESSIKSRSRFWTWDFHSVELYNRSLELNRKHLRRIIGAVDKRVPFEIGRASCRERV